MVTISRKLCNHVGTNQQNIGADYTADEVEFLRAMEQWMSETGRRFPTFTDVLRIARSLGYRKTQGGSTDAGCVAS